MSKDEVLVECIRRNGFSPLFICYFNGTCKTFYNLESVSKWLTSQGVADDDEFWEKLYELQDT
jgi:hypothetical protein